MRTWQMQADSGWVFLGIFPSQSSSQVVAHADSLLDSSSWTKEEKTMIDELGIRIQENYDMTLRRW